MLGETARDTARGDENALQYARKMISAHPRLRYEFLYIIIWTARRLGRYQESHNTIREGLQSYPEDARFYHGRSENTLCWLEDAKQKSFCPLTAADAMEDAKRALELYGREPTGRTGVRAVQLNNIAWIHASPPRNSREYNLHAARQALDQLKEVMPRESWLPAFGQFFHTEVLIEFEEFKHERDRPGVDRQMLRGKLEYSYDAINQAMKVGDSTIYHTLRDVIKRDWALVFASMPRFNELHYF